MTHSINTVYFGQWIIKEVMEFDVQYEWVSGTPFNKEQYCQGGNYTLIVCRREIGSQIELWLYSNCEVGTWPGNITRFITFDGFQIA